MNALSLSQSFIIPIKVIRNYLIKKPLIMIFEVTLSCNARCKHCNITGHYPDEKRMPPEDYGKYISDLRPAVVELSGGEPLLRDDLTEIIRSIKESAFPPYIILVSNGYLLNQQKYLELKEAGLDILSVSMDFPNEEHDKFRRVKGLYAHLADILPKLSLYRNNDIVVNCAISWANLPYLEDLVQRCIDWKVKVSFSAYSALRTGDEKYLISSEDDLQRLQETIEKLIALKRESGVIANPTSILINIYKFFRDGGIPDCSAGKRFLFVQPDGKLNPCAMFRKEVFSSWREMLNDFPPRNICEQCYVACRAYTDRSLWTQFKDLNEFIKY
ncbi:radical SAM protein [Candidatus Poribacteria bacterium]|nr:radical SAM protein [Candidatus Poribacteria bacterium]